MSKLNIGDKAPDIQSTDQHGNSFQLSTFKGKKVVLYFYPKDDTPGCTKEACNLRDNYARFQSEGYEIVGVSADTAERHQKFIAKYDLPFTLLADIDKKVINAYEAWGLKKFMGKEYEGIIRKTFVIEENGIIEDIIEKVKTKEHTSQILK